MEDEWFERNYSFKTYLYLRESEKGMDFSMEIVNLYNLNETIAKDLMLSEKQPWKILPKINDFILQ